jgi:ATP-dependent DNA helicase DinG
MSINLGRWAVIDIETSGINPHHDSIIDLGFLQFDGCELIKEHSTLVRCEERLSPFITKLTGITNKMIRKAPMWEEVRNDLWDLAGHQLIAHHACFEESFLAPEFEQMEIGDPEKESYLDTIYFLALLFPHHQRFSLESFIVEWNIAPAEEHRGLQDSIDLLKVMLVAITLVRRDAGHRQSTEMLFNKYQMQEHWFGKFFLLTDSELNQIANAIKFDIDEKIDGILKNSIEQSSPKELNKFSWQFSGENIKQILGSEEIIQEVIPGYHHRSSQETMALKVGQSLKNGVHSLVQAPTGTGKTLGYLLPAALYSKEEKQQILISTGTKTLQHQAITKDVPNLQKILGPQTAELRIVPLVGSNNHLCELLFQQKLRELDLFSSSSFEEYFNYLFFEFIFEHNRIHGTADPILRSALPYVIKRADPRFGELEREIAVDFRSCTTHKCPLRFDCSYFNGLQDAKEADLIIGNHALMFSWPRSFPRPKSVIVDESHKIEDEATRAFSVELDQRQLVTMRQQLETNQGVGSLFYLMGELDNSNDLIATIKEATLTAAKMLQDHLLVLPELIEQFFKSRHKYTELYWNEIPMLSKDQANDPLSRGIINHLLSIQTILADYHKKIEPWIEYWNIENVKDDNSVIALTRFNSFIGQLEDINLAFELAMEQKEGHAHTMKYHQDIGFALLSAPINIGEVVYNQLLSTSESVVFTSATLGSATGEQGTKGIEWATGYSYLEPEKRFRTGFFLPAIYDYKNRSKVYLCDDLPPMRDINFIPDSLGPVLKLIQDIGGRSLLLYSAKTRFEAACNFVLDKLEGVIPVFIQGMGQNVIEQFQKSSSGILIGMESFGEGIDIPGDALQFIFIDKIPDLRMDQVIQDRRKFYQSHLGNEFVDYYLARRTRSLHQKLGRLLRTESDFGGVIIVDSRIRNWKGRTMQNFMELMKPYQIERTPLPKAIDGVRDFLGQNNNSCN